MFWIGIFELALFYFLAVFFTYKIYPRMESWIIRRYEEERAKREA